MKSIGVFIKGQCLVYIYPSRDKTWKFRSTQSIDRTKRDGNVEKYVYRSDAYSSVQEALPFVCRFIKKQYNLDLDNLAEGEVEFNKVPFSGRVSPTDVPGFMAKKFEAFLAADSSILNAVADEDDEEEEAAEAAEKEEVDPTPDLF